MIASATGESRKQSGLMNQQTATKQTAERATSNIAIGLVTSLWRPGVRGVRLSISQSARRLNAIAAVRAKTIASRISKASGQSGRPRAATSIDPTANGSAKIV